jgi:hypothetical protein
MAMSEALAERALEGVGDASLGEWREAGGNGVFHLRRGVTAAEAALVGPVEDIRGTPEETRRFAALLADAPYLGKFYPHLRNV